MSRQDYIVRVRYQNTLPPPPCGPKLLKNPLDFDNLLDASALSSLVYARELDPIVDQQLGMPIDLVQVPNSFQSQMFEIMPEQELDPEDLALLDDPSAGVPAANSVAFLRRTEYSSGAMIREGNNRKSLSLGGTETPADQLKRVEDSFEKAEVSLDKLVHPKNRVLKAKRSWKFIPDTKQLDLVAKSIRMVGSAALSQNKQVGLTRDQLASSVFANTSVDNDKWTSFFTPRAEDAEAVLAAKLNQEDACDDQLISYEKVQDYEPVDVRAKNKYDEVVISLDDEVAYYLPVTSRINLKRRRVEAHKLQQLQEHEVDVLNATRTDITPEQSILRDQKRSKYDPVNYE